jgi:hypothetical protein
MQQAEKEKLNGKKGHLLKCPRSGCGYTWMCTGRFLLYATCPSCRRNVRIFENKIELQSVPVGGQSQTATSASVNFHDQR